MVARGTPSLLGGESLQATPPEKNPSELPNGDWAGYLAIETSTPLCGVALGKGGRVALRRQRVTTHSEKLLSLIAEVLDELGCTPKDLKGVLCGAGPGSFTGLRIGLATAKGLCFALSIPLTLVSSLETLAFPHKSKGVWLVPCIDAYQGQVYARLLGEAPSLPEDHPLRQDRAWDPQALKEAIGRARNESKLPVQLKLVGDGVVRYSELQELVPPDGDTIADPYPHPVSLLHLGLQNPLQQTPLASAAPTYICPPAIRTG